MHKLLFTDNSCWVLEWGNASEIDIILKERCFPSPIIWTLHVDWISIAFLATVSVASLWKYTCERDTWYMIHCVSVFVIGLQCLAQRERPSLFNSKETLRVIICVCNNALCFSFFSFLISVLERRRRSWFLEKLMGYILPHPPKMRCKHCRQLPLGERKLVWEGALWKHLCLACRRRCLATSYCRLCDWACPCFVPSLPLMAVLFVTVYPFPQAKSRVKDWGGGGG